MRTRAVILCLVLLGAALPLASAAAGIPQPSAQIAATLQPAATFDIGLPGGDGYYPGSVVVDEARQVAYVYNTDSPQRRPVISVIRLSDGQPQRVIPLEPAVPGGRGRLLLGTGGRLLFVDLERGTITRVDTDTGRLDVLLSGVRDAAAAPDGTQVYVVTGSALKAYSLAGLEGRRTPQWEASGAFDTVAAGDKRVAVLAVSAGGPQGFASYEAATGARAANTTVSEPVSALAAGGDGSWVLVTTGEKPKLRRFDAALRQTHEVVIPYAYDVSYDAPRNRYLLSGFQYDGKVSTTEIFAFSALDLSQVAVREGAGSDVPTLFATWGRDKLLGYSRSGPARLDVLDADLKDAGRMIFGARPVDMALDELRGRLYVADEHDRVHVLELPDGRRSGLWEGGAPLALDAKNGLLYAGLPGRVVALDASGVKVAEFPQEGVPAPDPNRDLVYIVSNGVTLYDRAGRQLGQLDSTFPQAPGTYPSVSAQAAYVNPVSGYLGVVMHNGVAGSNSGTFLRIYPPKTDAPVQVPGVFSFVTDLTFDPSGNFYVTYSPAKSMDAVQVLDPQGRELRKLSGRSGRIALDAGAGQFYLLTSGAVTRAAMDTLTPSAFFDGPREIERLQFSPSRQTFYANGGLTPRVRVIPVDELTPVGMRARAGAPPQDAYLEQLYVTSTGRTDTLIARYSDGLYRTRDGKRWEKLPVGIAASWRQVSIAPKGVLWWAGLGYDGGDGAWRSTDGGTTWAPMLAGLRDLRLMGESGLAAAGADEAYAVTRTAGLLRWNSKAKAWEAMGPEPPAQSPGKLHMAPGGKELFHSAFELLRKSTDGGRTWQALKMPAQSGNLIGFSGFYTVTKTMYAMWGDTEMRPMRSTDGGATWAPLRTRIALSRDYYTPEIASLGYETYLLARRYSNDDSVLLRSTDNGDSWQVAPVALSRSVFHIALGMGERLWLGGKNAVRAVDPRTIKWVAAGPAGTTPTVPPQPTPSATPPLPSCDRALQGAEAEAAARAPELGCPTGAASEVGMARQAFQNGQMIWRSDNRAIYVIYNKGTWTSYADTWVEGEPASDPSIVAPQGLEQPVRGFGKVWREQLGGVKAGIGWALGKEQGVSGVVQQWDRGTVFRFGGEMIIVINGGRVR